MLIYNMSLRTGHGYDVHQLKEGLPLIIGGENILLQYWPTVMEIY